MSVWDQNKIEFVEELHVLYLDRKNGVIADYYASKGGTTGTVIQPQHVILAAMK